MSSLNNHFAVILAGGSGTRFWPLSRRARPKQFLNITGAGTLLEETIKRILPQFPSRNIYIVANQKFVRDISPAAKTFGIPSANLLFEPQAKNTAPAVLWAAHIIKQKNPQAVWAVLPADHLILNQRKFLNIVRQALQVAGQGYLTTLGIVPTRPETGYGYLKTRKMTGTAQALKVEKFTEKPNLPRAKEFARNKNYFWNSGMFFWRADVILDAFKRFLPKDYALVTAAGTDQKIKKIWSKLTSISVDYGILEKSDNVAAVKAESIGWSDVGSWEAAHEVLPKDVHGNVHRANVISVNGKNNFIYSENKTIAVVGVSDVVVVDTPDALLICRKDISQQVRDVVEILKLKKQDIL